MNNNKINQIFTGLAFVLPFIIYLMTMAPTVSLWDCGEFIATSITLGVPHPPGTPLYLLIGNFFSQIPILNDLGARVNLVSPIASALSVMFLYMIITNLILEMTKKESFSSYAAGFIGAMTFAITDSQWFNAVEAEVYALSTFFTAVVIWLILKWASNFKRSSQIKYLILISYCIGLAIGIHLLNLLAIPFIGLIIFFKYSSSKINWMKVLVLIAGTGLSFLIIYKGIIKGLPSIANKTSDPTILYIFLIITITSIIISNISKMNHTVQQGVIVLFTSMLLFITINELFITDYTKTLKMHYQEIQSYSYHLNEMQNEIYQKFESSPNQEAQTFYYMDLIQNGIKSDIANWVVNNTQKQIDSYNTSGMNYFDLLTKQNAWALLISLIILILGIRSLFVFEKKYPLNYYKISRLIISCAFMIVLGYSTYSLIFIRAQQNPKINYNNPHDIKSAYQYINRDQYGQWSILDRKTSMIINSQGNNESWKRYTKKTQEPTREEITNFVWNYQFKEMYLRYFAWQFIGKEEWTNKSWERNSLDGTQLISMRPLQGINFWRYGIPLAFIIGLFGLYYHFNRDPRRAFAVLTLFILTGLAIVIYLNQSDPQPRERDYAYVGSFFAFSIWIGIGCYAIINEFKKYFNIKPIITALTLLLFIPINMGFKDWHEHDRSNRYEAWDYAYNLLNSCEPNSVLFTNGDNDTFPLWYIQQVENVREDVKVVNLSLLNFPSYIRQLDEHTPSLMIFNLNAAASSSNQYLNIVESEDYEALIAYAFKHWLKNDYNTHIITDSGKEFKWKFTGGTYGLGLTNITIMKIIEQCFDKRPIYFSTTTGNNNLGLDDYLVQEGLVYKLSNTKNNTAMDIRMNVDKTINMITKSKGEPGENENNFVDLNQNGKWDTELIIRSIEDYKNHQKWIKKYPDLGLYRYTGLNQKGIFYGPHIERLAANYRNVFFKTATNIALDIKEENHLRDSFQIMELIHQYLPNTIIPTEISYDYGVLSYCQHLLQILQYIIVDNQNKKNVQLENDIQLIENNIMTLLSNVDPELVKKYFPDFIAE
tara:strand:- start:639 stop:3788 length:3150 start_codon:yes stop_codon:yes gene_type:complete